MKSITRRAINEDRKAIEDKKKEIMDLQKQRADLEDKLRHAEGPAGGAGVAESHNPSLIRLKSVRGGNSWFFRFRSRKDSIPALCLAASQGQNGSDTEDPEETRHSVHKFSILDPGRRTSSPDVFAGRSEIDQ